MFYTNKTKLLYSTNNDPKADTNSTLIKPQQHIITKSLKRKRYPHLSI